MAHLAHEEMMGQGRGNVIVHPVTYGCGEENCVGPLCRVGWPAISPFVPVAAPLTGESEVSGLFTWLTPSSTEGEVKEEGGGKGEVGW